MSKESRGGISSCGTTNRLPLISIPAARTKATRLLYLRIDHARIYTSIRSALAPFLPSLHSPGGLPFLLYMPAVSSANPAGKKSIGAPCGLIRFSSIEQTSSPPLPLPPPFDLVSRARRARGAARRILTTLFTRAFRQRGYPYLIVTCRPLTSISKKRNVPTSNASPALLSVSAFSLQLARRFTLRRASSVSLAWTRIREAASTRGGYPMGQG